MRIAGRRVEARIATGVVLVAVALVGCAAERHEELIGDFSAPGVEVFLDQMDGELFYLRLRLGAQEYGRSAQYRDGELVGSLDDFGQAPFTIRPLPDGAGLVLETGGKSYRLTRPGAELELGGVEPEPAGPGQREAAQEPPATAERDPRLVGSWSRQEMISTPQGTIATQIFLAIHPDGTFVETMGDTLAGGADWSGGIGGGGGQSAEWRTQGGVFHVRMPGTAQWIPLARYVLQPGRMLFIYGDGSQHLWFGG